MKFYFYEGDEMVELKPCPFCGSVDVKVHIPYFMDDCYMVKCCGCNCSTAIYKTVNQAIKAWNRRCDVDEKKLSCHFEHCRECLSLIKRRIPDTEVAFEIRCGRKHKGIILKGNNFYRLAI